MLRTASDGSPALALAVAGAPDPVRPAAEFVAALLSRDRERLVACLARNVRFRALTPNGLREREGATETARLIFDWFEGVDDIEVLDRGVEPVAHRAHAWYRLRVGYPDGGPEVVRQDAFCDAEDGRITDMDLVCSGFLEEPVAPAPGVQRFDAGDLGCGTGLPQEFRRRIQSVAPGGILEVTVRDPAAKEDLPALARLLGHRVRSIRPAPDGSTLLAIERGTDGGVSG